VIVKEKVIIQKPFNKVLKENGDAMEYYRDHPEAHWKDLIKNFEGSRIKFEHWCHKAYLGQRGPKGSDQSKYDKAMAYFDSHQNQDLNESFQLEQILTMSFKQIIEYNGGDNTKTLQELNELMSRLQGTNDDNERKAYFKAKKFYERLVEFINKKNI